MQVLVDMRVVILEGDEKGREFISKRVEETYTQFTEVGVLERLRLEWTHLHGMPTPVEVEEEKSCSECAHSGRPAFMYPCTLCENYCMFTKVEKKEEAESEVQEWN